MVPDLAMQIVNFTWKQSKYMIYMAMHLTGQENLLCNPTGGLNYSEKLKEVK